MVLSLLASCDVWQQKEIPAPEPAPQGPDPENLVWRGPMYFYFLDDRGNDLLDFNAGPILYPVHYPTPYMPKYKAPDTFTDIIDYNVLPWGSSVIGRYYSGNWSTIIYDKTVGLYQLYMHMPFSNLTSGHETFYVARSAKDIDRIDAQIIYLTEGIAGGGPNPRLPYVQKLWYNDVLIMDDESEGDQRAFIVKNSDGSTSVYPKTRPTVSDWL